MTEIPLGDLILKIYRNLRYDIARLEAKTTVILRNQAKQIASQTDRDYEEVIKEVKSEVIYPKNMKKKLLRMC